MKKNLLFCKHKNIPLQILKSTITPILLTITNVYICLIFCLNLFLPETGWTLYKVYGDFRISYRTGLISKTLICPQMQPVSSRNRHVYTCFQMLTNWKYDGCLATMPNCAREIYHKPEYTISKPSTKCPMILASINLNCRKIAIWLVLIFC